MDGTLTEPVHDFELIRTKLGIPLGPPILEAIRAMPTEKAAQVRENLENLEMELAGQASAQPGIFQIVEKLVNRGKKLGILTRNSEEIAAATLRACGLIDFFQPVSIIGRETCLPKPEPDGVNHLIEYWGASKAETVLVGDFLYDIQAGYQAGIKTVHFDQSGEFKWPQYTNHRITAIAELESMI